MDHHDPHRAVRLFHVLADALDLCMAIVRSACGVNTAGVELDGPGQWVSSGAILIYPVVLGLLKKPHRACYSIKPAKPVSSRRLNRERRMRDYRA